MARSFDGSTGYLSSDTTTELTAGGSWTVACWVLMRTAPGDGSGLMASSYLGGGNPVPLALAGGGASWGTLGRWGIGYYDGASWASVSDTEAAPVGVWTHVAATLDAPGSMLRFYRNGQIRDFGALAGAGGTASAFLLGKRWDAGGNPFLDGAMAEAAQWSEPLSPGEILSLSQGRSPAQVRPGSLRGYWPLDEYEGGGALDRSRNVYNLSLTGVVTPAPGVFLPYVTVMGLEPKQPPPSTVVPFYASSTVLYPPVLVGILDVPYLPTVTGLWPPVIYNGSLPPVAPPSLPIAPPTGYTFATAALGCVVFIAATPGPAGNLIMIEYVVAGTNTPLSMSVGGNDVTINLATDAAGNPISTAGEVISLVNSDSETTALLAQEWDLLNASPEIIAWRAANPTEATAIDAYRAQAGAQPAGIDDVSDALISITTAWLISELVTASLAPGCTNDDVLIALVPTPLDGGGSPGDPGGGGGSGPPGGGFGGPRFYTAPPWRWAVSELGNSPAATLTFLDHLMDDVSVGYVLNAPWWASGSVPSDDPEVNILADALDQTSPFVTEGERILLGFRREGGSPKWKIRFAGILDQLEDSGRTEAARSALTAHDLWQYLYHRPVCSPDGDLPGANGFSFSSTRASTIALDYIENSIANMGDMWLDTTSGTIEDTVVLDEYNIQQGESLGELLANLCNTGTIDVVFTPIYDPIARPGIFWELNLVSEYGTERDEAIFAWDKPSRNVSQISRLKDGSTRANKVQYYRDQGGPPVPLQTDSDSVDRYREYWSQQFFPGQTVEGAVAALAKSVLALRKDGQITVTVSPTPERMPFLFTEFFLGDRVPVYASQTPVAVPNSGGTFRQQLAGYQRVYGIPIRIVNGLERVERLIASVDAGVSS